MTAKRYLLGAVAAVCVAGAAWGQPAGGHPPLPASPFPPVAVDGVLPAGADEPAPAPAAPTPAAAPTAPFPPPPPTATTVLTGAPAVPPPPGTVCSPWCGPGGCCGPVGGNGPLTYELYAATGPSFPVSGVAFDDRLNVGWTVGGGARTLWFDVPGTAAWAFDLGLSYTYNRGDQRTQMQVFTPQPRNQNGELLGPDQLQVHVMRGLHRTNFNFAVGRDYFLRGPGYLTPDGCGAVNWRVGGDVGGRWGTAHVDLVPIADPNNYFRKQGVTQSVFVGFHAHRERNMGGWVLFTGLRTEWDYTWTNLIPPNNGDIVSINLLMYAGVRF